MNVLENADSILVKNLGFSNRAYGVLSRNNIITAAELLKVTETEILSFKNAGKKTVEEILNKQKEIQSGNCEVTGMLDVAINPAEDFSKWITTIEGINKCREYLKAHDIRIANMGLSVRAYNSLSATGITFLSEIVGRSLSEIRDLNNLGKLTAEEVYYTWVDYVTKVKSEILPDVFTDKAQWFIKELANREDYRDKILEYVYYNNEPIENLNLSVRSFNCLDSAGIKTLHDLIMLSPIELANLKNMGATSLNEIKNTIDSYYDKNNDQIMAFCDPNFKIVHDDAYIEKKIFGLYKKTPFVGCSVDEFVKYMSFEVPKDRICHVIGILLSAGKLEYVDNKCYKKHTSVKDYLNKCIENDSSNRNLIIFLERLNGSTLEDIGNNYGLTRERVRQICEKTITKLKAKYVQETGEQYFDEDYFTYLFSEYVIDRSVWNKTLSTPAHVYNYLDQAYGRIKGKGKKDINKIYEDRNISESIKLRFRLQEESAKIVIDGQIIGKNRSEVEDYVISQIATSDIRFDDYVVAYNKYLKDHFVPYDESIYYTDSVLRTRENKLSVSRYVLWKQGKKFRYYDIDSRNYDELIELIDLPKYHNIRISTQKLMDENADLMEQYDIRDCYELHNLLNKIVNKNSCDNIDFRRMPHIQFGTFDPFATYEEIITCLTPITETEFLDYVYQEYGFDRASLLASPEMVQIRALYYKDGVYAAENKIMPDSNKVRLSRALTEEVYLVDDIKKIYANLIPGADTDEINKFNLATINYNLRSGFAMKGFTSVNSFIRHVLLKDPVFDISPYKKLFSTSQAFYIVLMELKRNYDLFEYEPNKYVNYSKIAELGITKADLKKYCDTVIYSFEDGVHFTIKTVIDMGIKGPLDDLGYTSYFNERLLAADDRLAANTLCGTHMFYKGGGRVSAVSFTNYIMKDIESIELPELFELYKNQFGIQFDDKWDLITKLTDSNFFYDSMTDTLYVNKEMYYKALYLE